MDIFLMSKGKIYGGYKWMKKMEDRLKNPLCLEQYGYKVYSQNDEDGILEEIFNRIGCTNKRFVEFGVQNGLECNTHYLLHKGWKGLWIEGDTDAYNEISIRFDVPIQLGALNVENAFITRENINSLIGKYEKGNIDLLSIDIDGNDWHIWKTIEVIDPRVVVIEYNAQFSPDVEWVMGYNSEHIWNGDEWFGASLRSLEVLGNDKGYQLVGTNLTGTNAFFVKRELTGDKFYKPATAMELYSPENDMRPVQPGYPVYVCSMNQKEGTCKRDVLGKKYNWIDIVRKNEEVIFYGAGSDAESYYRLLSDTEKRHIIICDKRAEDSIVYFHKKKVLSPREIMEMHAPILITSSKYCTEIENDLIDMGYDAALIHKCIRPNEMGL